jgi:hypothetical protein
VNILTLSLGWCLAVSALFINVSHPAAQQNSQSNMSPRLAAAAGSHRCCLLAADHNHLLDRQPACISWCGHIPAGILCHMLCGNML